MNLNFHVNCKDFGFTSMFSYYAIQKKIFEIVKKNIEFENFLLHLILAFHDDISSHYHQIDILD